MKRTLLFIAFCLTIVTGFSQDSLVVVNFTIPDTVTLNQTDQIRVQYEFQAPQGDSLVGPVLMRVRVNNILIPDTVAFTNVMAMNADTFSVQNSAFSFGVTNNFVPGNNIVVVWPATGDPSIGVDSITTTVYVIDGSGRSEYADLEVPGCYPSFIRPGQTLWCDSKVEQVRLVDIMGRGISLTKDLIVIPPVPAGIYFLDIRSGDMRWSKRIYITN